MAPSTVTNGRLSVVPGAAMVVDRSQALAPLYAPRRMILAIPSDAAGLPEALAAKTAREGTVAYVCRGPTCSEPVASAAGLLETLTTRGARP